MTSKKRLILSYGILALLLAVLFAANLFWGSVSLTPGAVLAALTGRGQDALSVGIITQLRLPRAVMVVLLGAALSAAGYLLQTFFPVAPAIISLFVPAVAAVCVPMGISAAVPTLIITIVAAGTYLLPINPISALSFDYGYYSSADMAKAGLIPSVAL